MVRKVGKGLEDFNHSHKNHLFSNIFVSVCTYNDVKQPLVSLFIINMRYALLLLSISRKSL